MAARQCNSWTRRIGNRSDTPYAAKPELTDGQQLLSRIIRRSGMAIGLHAGPELYARVKRWH